MKFFLSTGGAIVLLFALQANFPVLRDWRLLYGYFTIVVVLCEKVRPACTSQVPVHPWRLELHIVLHAMPKLVAVPHRPKDNFEPRDIRPQVETTVSKGAIRVSTTALGGALAVAVMAHSTAATNPYLLTAVICVFDFGVCLFMLSKFKYAGDSLIPLFLGNGI